MVTNVKTARIHTLTLDLDDAELRLLYSLLCRAQIGEQLTPPQLEWVTRIKSALDKAIR